MEHGEVMASVPDDLAVFCRHEYPRLVGALSLYCGDGYLAEELAQEALARACARWGRVSQMAAPGAWVHRVAINAAKSHWRRGGVARRARAQLADPEVGIHVDPDVASDVALREAVARLPERQRRALVLRYFADLSPAETAGVMGISAQAVRNLTHRAITQLRESDLVGLIEEGSDVH